MEFCRMNFNENVEPNLNNNSTLLCPVPCCIVFSIPPWDKLMTRFFQKGTIVCSQRKIWLYKTLNLSLKWSEYGIQQRHVCCLKKDL